MTTIWVDADSCPVLVRQFLIKSAKRLNLPIKFVANHIIPQETEYSLFQMIICQEGEGVADDYIVENTVANDMVVTRDIPLAQRLLEKQISVLNDRGTIFTKDNIKRKLADRDFNLQLAQIGLTGYKKSNYSKKEFASFAKAFDKEINAVLKQSKYF